MVLDTLEEEVNLPPADIIEPPSGRIAWNRFLLPISGVLAGLAVLALFLPPGLRQSTFAFLGLYLLPGGIDFGIPVAIGALDLEPWWVLALVTYFDLWITLFWVWNLDHLTRYEWVDKRVHKSRERVHSLWERFPWLAVASGPGLAMFILLPIPWTGSFAGIVVGKLINLGDLELFVASIVGTALRVAMLAFGFEGIFTFFF